MSPSRAASTDTETYAHRRIRQQRQHLLPLLLLLQREFQKHTIHAIGTLYAHIVCYRQAAQGLRISTYTSQACVLNVYIFDLHFVRTFCVYVTNVCKNMYTVSSSSCAREYSWLSVKRRRRRSVVMTIKINI